MRLTINNAPPTIESLIRYASRFFSVPGNVTVNFRRPKTGARRWFSGFCYYGQRPLIVIRAPLETDSHFPYERKTLGYFPASQIPITPYKLETWQELVVHIAAHEFSHLMRAGQKFRKSRIEVFCENRATEVLEAYRSGGQLEISADAERMAGAKLAKDLRDKQAADYAVSDIAKHESLLAAQKRWTTKAKRADTALKKIARKLRALERLRFKRSATPAPPPPAGQF